jgi:Zn-dependent M28 family amino/carboxypeptidase
MAFSLAVSPAAMMVQSAEAGPASCAARVNNTHAKLLECTTLEGTLAHQEAFQAIADENGGDRFSGASGYDESVAYVVDQLEAAGYSPTVQPFIYTTYFVVGPSALKQTAPGDVTYVEGTDFQPLEQTDPGNVTAAVTAVDLQLGLGNASTSGCEAADFAGFPAGNIALIQRGTCTFELKAENAAAAGAVGAIIFNQGNTPDRTGLINGTLGNGNTSGIPVHDATYALGSTLAGIPGLTMQIVANVFRGPATTYNVLAETSGGDPNNVVMVGAHLDSVDDGPGIQDNGSGSSAILETALQMRKVQPRNKVRFAWWGAEESGLVGSTYYVTSLSVAEQAKIALYLNFDMIASPNFVYFIYDGDNSDGGATPGPAGSAQIEKLFETYYGARQLPFKGTAFDGRSDYGPFIAAGIPAGGLFTGAEGIKTAEEAALWGGTAGQPYDPCYHLACDTIDNLNADAYDVNIDAVAYATLQYAMNTSAVNGVRGKGNFKQKKAQGAAAASTFRYWGPQSRF